MSNWCVNRYEQVGHAYQRDGQWFVRLRWDNGYEKHVRIDHLQPDQDRCPLCGDVLYPDVTIDESGEEDVLYDTVICVTCGWSLVTAGMPWPLFRRAFPTHINVPPE